jgi:hypothetical protein
LGRRPTDDPHARAAAAPTALYRLDSIFVIIIVVAVIAILASQVIVVVIIVTVVIGVASEERVCESVAARSVPRARTRHMCLLARRPGRECRRQESSVIILLVIVVVLRDGCIATALFQRSDGYYADAVAASDGGFKRPARWYLLPFISFA